MRHVTPLRTMRRLWVDASVVWWVEFGTWTSSRVTGKLSARRERRKEGSGRCSYARGGGRRGRTRSVKISSQKPGHPAVGAQAHAAATPRRRTDVVDDARVAGGIAADGMNINARPRRRVAGQDTYCQRRIVRHPMLSLYGTGVFSLSRKIFCQEIMRGRGDGVRRTTNNDKILRTWLPPAKHRSCRRAACAAPET